MDQTPTRERLGAARQLPTGFVDQPRGASPRSFADEPRASARRLMSDFGDLLLNSALRPRRRRGGLNRLYVILGGRGSRRAENRLSAPARQVPRPPTMVPLWSARPVSPRITQGCLATKRRHFPPARGKTGASSGGSPAIRSARTPALTGPGAPSTRRRYPGSYHVPSTHVPTTSYSAPSTQYPVRSTPVLRYGNRPDSHALSLFTCPGH